MQELGRERGAPIPPPSAPPLPGAARAAKLRRGEDVGVPSRAELCSTARYNNGGGCSGGGSGGADGDGGGGDAGSGGGGSGGGPTEPACTSSPQRR